MRASKSLRSASASYVYLVNELGGLHKKEKGREYEAEEVFSE